MQLCSNATEASAVADIAISWTAINVIQPL